VAVEVWLGNEPRYPSEKETIIKLAEELDKLNEFYIIMANVKLEIEYDAIVLSSNKIINLEIKEFTGPFETKNNGPWYFLDTKKEYLPNPFEELQKRYYKLKDWLQKHSHQLVQSPNQQEVFKNIKSIICVVPEIHPDSKLNEKSLRRHVRIVGLNDLAQVIRSCVSEGLNLSQEALRKIPELLNLKKIDWRTDLSLAQSEPSEKIKRALIPFSISQYTQHFVGRAFLDKALDKFLSSHDRGYWILKGEPGIGKTSWAAHLVAVRGYVYHFFDRTQGIIRAEQAIKNIAAQLIHKHGLVDLEPLLDHPEPSALLSEVLSRVSEKITPLSKKEIIVIDALDEAEPPSQTGSSNVMRLPASLPPGVFVVATTCPTEIKRLYVAAGTPCEEFTLASDNQDNRRDIETFIRECLDEKLKARIERIYQSEEKFIAAVLERSEGNFMYVVRLIDDIRNNRIANLGKLPVGLQGYYKENLKRLENQSHPKEEWRHLHKPVLGILSVVAEPVTSSQIAAWLKLPQADVESSLEYCREVLTFLKGEADQLAVWSIYDKRFQEFLQSEFDQKHFHEIIVDHYRDQCNGQWHHLRERYALKHLAHHMRLSGRYADLVSFISRDMRERKLHILGTDLSFRQDLEEAFQAAAEFDPPKLADLFKFRLMLENLIKGPSIPIQALEAMALLGQQEKAREYALLQHGAHGLARIASALLSVGKKEEAIRQGNEALQMLKSKRNPLCELSTAAYLELVCTFSSVAPYIAEKTFEELLRLLSESEEYDRWWNIDYAVEELQKYMPRLLQSAPQSAKRLVLEVFDKSSSASASIELLVSYIEHSARHDPSSAVEVARRAYAWLQEQIMPQISSQEWRVHPPEHYLVMMARALQRVGMQSESESIVARLGSEWKAQLEEIILLESSPEKCIDKLYELRQTSPRRALPLSSIDRLQDIPKKTIENARHAYIIEECEEKLVDFAKELIGQGEIAQALNIVPHLCPYLRIPILIEAARYLASSNPDESRRLIHQVRELVRDAYSLHWHKQFYDIMECRAYATRELALIDAHVARELVEMVVSSPSYSHPEPKELPIGQLGQPGFEPVALERSSELRKNIENIRKYSSDPHKTLLVKLIEEIAKDGNIELAFDLMKLDPEYRRAYFAVLAELAHKDPQRALANFEEILRVARDVEDVEYILGYMVEGALYDEVLDWMQKTQLRSPRIIDRILTQLLAKKDFAKAEQVLEFLNAFDVSKKEEWIRKIEQAKLPPQKHHFTHQQINALLSDAKKFLDFMQTDQCYELLDFLINTGKRPIACQIFHITKLKPLYERLAEGEPVEDELLDVGERMAELGLTEDLGDLCAKVLIFLTAEQGYDWIHWNTGEVVSRLNRLIEAVPAEKAYPMIIAVLKEAGVATAVILTPAIRKLGGSYLLRQVFDVVREYWQYSY
jgi:hypothetical protein